MRSFLFVLTLATSAILFAGEDPIKADSDQPFAVVELFTSEGCSSCPPAENYLNELAVQTESQRIMPLAFHVDYWDYLGWRDPYAQKAFTQRQRRYARDLHPNRVYTPQMIVNGRHVFVGSDRDSGGIKINRELKRQPKVDLSVKVQKGNTGSLTINYQSQANAKHVLNVALVSNGHNSHVKAGENRGRRLQHENVVRVFKERALKQASGQIELQLPQGMKQDDSRIIAYVQDTKSRQILAAQMVTL